MNRISVNSQLKCVRVWEGGRHADQTYFTVKQYGSFYKAFKAACAYEQQMPAWKRVGRIAARINSYSNSQSGVVGVCPLRNHSGEDAGWRANWVQDINGERRPKMKDFSFHSFGQQAFSLAVECRKKMVRQYMIST